MSRTRTPDPLRLDVLALCRTQETLEGHWPLAQLPRLAASVFADGGIHPATDALVDWSVSGQRRVAQGGAEEWWLHLRARTCVPLQCQRCLQLLPSALEVDRAVRFVHGEEQAERLDEELEDDVLALTPRLDTRELIEDELILAMPLVPRHEQCEAAAVRTSQPDPLPADDASGTAGSPHPFAALARLRGGG